MGALTIMHRDNPLLAMIRMEYPDYHPLIAIARLAHKPAVAEDPKLELECHKAILKYTEPELKSIEVKAPADEHRRVRVSLFEVVEEAEYTMIPETTGE